jgi:hypothetical protein
VNPHAETRERAIARPYIVTVAVAIAAVACCWIAYALVGRDLIESAYNGDGASFLSRMMHDREARSLSSYYTTAEQLLAHVSAGFVIAVTTVAALVSAPRTGLALRIWVVVVGGAVVAAMAVAEPSAHGDGPEYFLMAESWENHFSPELREGDLESLHALERAHGLALSHRDPAQYYFEARGGNRYCYHFWFYPMLAVPATLVLRLFDANEAQAFQLINALLLAAALFFIASRPALSVARRWALVLLAFFSPALWFVYWPHPEVFSFALVLVSVVLSEERRYRSAVVLAALAATQNPPLVFLVAWLAVRGVMRSRRRARECGLLALCALPAIVPFAFFAAHFGTASLIGSKATSWDNLSVRRAGELFFDLNVGMLPYLPVALAMFVGAVVRDLALERRATWAIQCAVVLFVLALACTPTYLWNHGTTGPSRYVIWMLPLVFVAITRGLDGPRRRLHAAATGAAIAFQATMVVAYGGLTPPLTQTSHTYVARFVLRHLPSLYNPSYEIFAVRTSHRMPEITYRPGAGYTASLPPTPIVFMDGERCRKALAAAGDGKALSARCGGVPERDADFFADPHNHSRLTYIDY